MTPTAQHTLARVLGACLPSRIVDPAGSEPLAARALAARLDAALETAGVEQPAVAIITDSLVSFLLGWGTRYFNIGDEVERGVGVLCLAVTGRPDLLPGGATLTDAHRPLNSNGTDMRCTTYPFGCYSEAKPRSMFASILASVELPPAPLSPPRLP